ncbi:MAG TPA: response regulator transcription factor [Fibrobacteraceae bacterium]|nr:response regulator transcription factor [Fibrobacteraceae bacterium]
MNLKILAVDDDSDILELIRYTLSKDGFQVFLAMDGNEAWGILNDESVDLVILDISLPGITGMEVCRRMKRDERLKNIPIIFVTARTQESDVLIGFQVGADDYVRKPFSPKELLARVNTLLKHSSHSEDAYRLHGFDISFDRHLLRVNKNRVNLTQREFGVLQVLIRSNGRTASRNMLLERVWGMDARSGPRSVDIVITRIRDKIKPYQNCIRTITGIGYQWDPDQVINVVQETVQDEVAPDITQAC